MQQYRVNYPLLIGLIVGTLVTSGVVYGIWRFQIERKSGWLIGEAKKADEAGDFREASRYYSQYLTVNSNDDEARLKYAKAYAGITELEDASSDELTTAVRVLEGIVRARDISDTPEAKELRLKLVKLFGRDNVRRYPDALEHLSYLLETDPANPELHVLRASYLFRAGSVDDAVKFSYQAIGYDPQTDTFDIKKATAPNDAEVYSNLAGYVRAKKDKPELADRIMDQLIEVNPKSAKAYLSRSVYRSLFDDPDGARADVEEALKLAPEDADVLITMAQQAAKDEDYDEAAKYLETGKKLNPNDVRYYMAAADLQMRQKNQEQAIAELDEGIKKLKGSNVARLLFTKADYQFQGRDLAGVRQTIEDVQKLRMIAPEFIEFYEARLMLAEGKWFEAAEALNRLRPKFADSRTSLSIDIDYNLGLCYEKLGRPDMALEAFDLILQQNPQHEPAKLGRQRVRAQQGLVDTTAKSDPTQQALLKEFERPKDQQDVQKIESMLEELAKKNEWDQTGLLIRKAQLAAMREDFDKANKLIAEASKLIPEDQKLSPQDLLIHRMAVQFARANPKVGPAKAQEILAKVVNKFGDLPELRIDKVDNLIALNAATPNKEELKSELTDLAGGIDRWNETQKAQFWGSLASKFLNLGMTDEAREYLTLAADAQPHELPIRLMLFNLALESNNDEAMKEAQDKILEIVGDKNDSAWLYAEARRQFSVARREQLGLDSLNDIRLLVSRALEQRPEWHELHVLNAEIELAAGNGLSALQHFDRAEQLGRPVPAAVAQHIKLLSLAGRFADAGKLLDRIPEPLRFTFLGQLYPEILFRTNQVDEALKQAQKAIETAPDNPQNYFWNAQLLARLSRAPNTTEARYKELMAQATQSMRKAVELQPEFPEAWFALISYAATDNNMEQAQAALRESQLALSGDNLQIFLAKSYEALGRWFDAETMYRAVYEARPEELPRIQQLAAFYLGNAYQQQDKYLKVAPLINKILRAGAEKKIANNDPNLTWARRMAANMLAGTGDYQNLLKAEKLLASNSQNGALALDDKLAMADLLASRPEPVSRLKALGLLEEVRGVQALDAQHEKMLGDLYYAVGGDWRKYKSQMITATSRFPNYAPARDAFIRRLLERGDQQSIQDATKQVEELNRIAPGNAATFELTVLVANKLGKQEQVKKVLLQRVPDFTKVKELTPPQEMQCKLLANLLVRLGDLDSAERIYRELAARNPNNIPELATFLGLHRSIDQCFEKLNAVYQPQLIPALLEVARNVVRDQRTEIGDKFDAQMQQWLDTGLRENPDSLTLQIVQADLYDMQKRYDEAIKLYRKLLDRPELAGPRRAIVLNNLSFLLALSGKESAGIDPMNLVQEAVQILGPNSEILDTRAVVHISRKEYKDAIQDLELSVTDNPTASKYFHKAQAHLLANENSDAVAAWEKAESLKLDRDAINLMEYDLYEDMKAKIDKIRGTSVTQTDGLRRAG